MTCADILSTRFISHLSNSRGSPDNSVKNPPAVKETPVHFLGLEDAGEGIGYPLQYSCGSAGNKSACNVGDLGSIPGLGRSPGEGNEIPWTVQSMGSQRVKQEWATFTHNS